MERKVGMFLKIENEHCEKSAELQHHGVVESTEHLQISLTFLDIKPKTKEEGSWDAEVRSSEAGFKFVQILSVQHIEY